MVCFDRKRVSRGGLTTTGRTTPDSRRRCPSLPAGPEWTTEGRDPGTRPERSGVGEPRVVDLSRKAGVGPDDHPVPPRGPEESVDVRFGGDGSGSRRARGPPPPPLATPGTAESHPCCPSFLRPLYLCSLSSVHQTLNRPFPTFLSPFPEAYLKSRGVPKESGALSVPRDP